METTGSSARASTAATHGMRVPPAAVATVRASALSADGLERSMPASTPCRKTYWGSEFQHASFSGAPEQVKTLKGCGGALRRTLASVLRDAHLPWSPAMGSSLEALWWAGWKPENRPSRMAGMPPVTVGMTASMRIWLLVSRCRASGGWRFPRAVRLRLRA